MKFKNILIAIAVLGIGVLIYKLLLGFVLPIALIVSLRYVLKFLLKGSESSSDQEIAQILTKNPTSSSIDNIVEIKPVEEDNGVEEENRVVVRRGAFAPRSEHAGDGLDVVLFR